MNKIKSVLIVDDSEIDQLNAAYAFEDYDPSIELLKAYDGSEALDILESVDTLPDLIFLDINMPGMDGHEFLEEYDKRGGIKAVVVMLTSSDQTADRSKCEGYDFVKDYAVKPLEPSYVATLVENLP